MTAVEFLKQNIPSLFVDDSGHYENLFQQALEMEKQQIIDAYNFSQIPHLFKWDAKQYYETYKNTKE